MKNVLKETKQKKKENLLRMYCDSEFSGKKRIQDTTASCSIFKDGTRSSEYSFRNDLNELFPEIQLLKQLRKCLKILYMLSNLLHDPRKRSPQR